MADSEQLPPPPPSQDDDVPPPPPPQSDAEVKKDLLDSIASADKSKLNQVSAPKVDLGLAHLQVLGSIANRRPSLRKTDGPSTEEGVSIDIKEQYVAGKKAEEATLRRNSLLLSGLRQGGLLESEHKISENLAKLKALANEDD